MPWGIYKRSYTPKPELGKSSQLHIIARDIAPKVNFL